MCACIPTLKPVYDITRESIRFDISYFTAKIPSLSRKNYHIFDRNGRIPFGGQSDNASRSIPNTATSAGGLRNVSVEISHPAYGGSDPWANCDRNVSIKMGDIHIERGWEVNRAEIQRPNNNTASYQLNNVGTLGDTELSGHEVV